MTIVEDAAVQWAINEFQTLFNKDVEALLKEHPPESKDDEGNPFWGGLVVYFISLCYCVI